MSGERMPVKMIGDILTAQLPHMQPYIRFCSCQLNGATLIQQKTDEVPEFKELLRWDYGLMLKLSFLLKCPVSIFVVVLFADFNCNKSF